VAVHPAARRRPKPRSGPPRHDGCGYFIASVTHRRTLPVPQPRRAMAKRWCYAARPAQLTSSKTAPATLRRLQPSIHHLLRRSAHHSPVPPRRQSAIDGHRPRRPPQVPSLEAFGRRPSARVDRSRRAGIRNPSQLRRTAIASHRPPRAANNGRSREGNGDSAPERILICRTGPTGRRTNTAVPVHRRSARMCQCQEPGRRCSSWVSDRSSKPAKSAARPAKSQ
jgi:hypothetical protein